MKNKGFIIKCINCGNETIIKNDTSNKDYKGEFKFYPIQSERISIDCKCGNEVYIEEY